MRNSWLTERSIETALLAVVTAIVLVLALAPIGAIIVISFTGSSTLEFPPPSWSLRWYESAWRLLDNTDSVQGLWTAFSTTLRISATVTVISAFAGVGAAYALVRYNFPGYALIEQLFLVPLIFPLVVLGVALLLIVNYVHIDVGFWPIVIGHVIVTFPFMLRNCIAALKGLNLNLEEAARVLGAGPFSTFFSIVLPQIRGGIVAGMMLVFIISFNEFTVTYFLYSVDTYPLSIWLFSRGTNALDPTIFALSAVLIVFNAAVIILLGRLSGRSTMSV